MHDIIDIMKRIIPLAKEYNLYAVYIFGSYARGEETEYSDIDILIDTKSSSINGLFELATLYEDLSKSLNHKIDLITLNALMQDDGLNLFREEVLKDMVQIYERL